ncbi:MAG: putative porin [Chlorobiales bacterium]|nr:putative porin [Chlorobiales bacterium]
MKKVALLVGLAAALGFNQAQAVDWNWNGDVRERFESQHTSPTATSDADSNSSSRVRTRVRFGVSPWINEELSAGVQLATGDDQTKETISRNQTYIGTFQPKNIYLNEAYLDYHPMFLNGDVNVVIGKRDISNTIIRIDNLVYDSDLTIEGATVQYGKDANGKEKDGLIALAGYYFLNENNTNTISSPYLYLAQAALKGEVSDVSYLFGGGYDLYKSLQNLSIVDTNAKTGVSSSVPTTWTNSGYNIAELFGKVGGQLTETLPWKVYGQYALNTASHADHSSIDDNKRNAWLAGVTIGDAKQVGQWALDSKYVRIERDAVFPLFTDSDRKVNDIVNVKGFEVAGTYHLVQNFTIGARYYQYNNIDASAGKFNPTLHQLQLDAVVKF